MSTGLPLLKFPLLVMEQVLGEMKFFEIISLSILSKRSARAVRWAGRYAPDLRMALTITKEECSLVIFTEERTRSVHWKFENLAENRKCQKAVWNIGGMNVTMKKKVHSTRKPYSENCLIFCSKSNKDLTVNAVISHFLSTFRNSKVTYLEVNFDGIDQKFQVKRAIQSIPTMEDIFLFGQDYQGVGPFILQNMEITDTYSNTSDLYTGGPLVPHLKCTETVNCNNASWMLPETLLSLNCHSIRLGKTRFRNEDLMEFLRKWKNSNGDEMKNITEVRIDVPLGIGQLDLSEFDPQPYNPDKDPRKYRKPSMFFVYDVSRGLEIERADGHIASIHQREDFIIFYVWHLNDDRSEDMEDDEEDQEDDDESDYEWVEA